MCSLRKYIQASVNTMMIVKDELSAAEIKSNNELLQQDVKVQLIITMACDEQREKLILKCSTAYESWTKLAEYFEKPMHQPTASLFRACKNVVKYLKGTSNYTLKLGQLNHNGLELYTDATYDVRATSGILVQYHGSTIMWFSRKQACQPTSTAEAEVYAIAEGVKELSWFNNLLNSLSIIPKTKIFCDNRAAIAIINNGVTNASKHILIRWQFIQDILLQINASIEYCDGRQQLADLFTKESSQEKLSLFKTKYYIFSQPVSGVCSPL